MNSIQGPLAPPHSPEIEAGDPGGEQVTSSMTSHARRHAPMVEARKCVCVWRPFEEVHISQ